MRLVITQTARSDLKRIGSYTREKWGAAQEKRYLAAIRERFAILRGRPTLGRVRSEIGNYRSLLVGQHAIFYRVSENSVVIIRVLHQQMDLKAHLPDRS